MHYVCWRSELTEYFRSFLAVRENRHIHVDHFSVITMCSNGQKDHNFHSKHYKLAYINSKILIFLKITRNCPTLLSKLNDSYISTMGYQVHKNETPACVEAFKHSNSFSNLAVIYEHKNKSIQTPRRESLGKYQIEKICLFLNRINLKQNSND